MISSNCLRYNKLVIYILLNEVSHARLRNQESRFEVVVKIQNLFPFLHVFEQKCNAEIVCFETKCHLSFKPIFQGKMYELICITLKVTTTIFDFPQFSYQNVEKKFNGIPTLYQQDALEIIRIMKTLTHGNYSQKENKFYIVKYKQQPLSIKRHGMRIEYN